MYLSTIGLWDFTGEYDLREVHQSRESRSVSDTTFNSKVEEELQFMGVSPASDFWATSHLYTSEF